MLGLRGIIFTILVPLVVGVYVPFLIDPWIGKDVRLFGLGWIPVVAGASIYLLCLLRFLASGGTPAIFFTRPLRFLIGEEPNKVVSDGLYRFSRNPMYVGVITLVFGQALLFGSSGLAIYGLFLFGVFHLVVVFIEEPHLRNTRGESYQQYCRTVPRWLGFRR